VSVALFGRNLAADDLSASPTERYCINVLGEFRPIARGAWEKQLKAGLDRWVGQRPLNRQTA
jgi:hypothetical protein